MFAMISTIRSKLLIAVLLLGVIPLGSAAGSLWVGYRVLEQSAYSQIAQLPAGAATRIEELLYFRYVDAIQYASLPALNQTDDDQVQDESFRRIKALYRPYAWVGLLTHNGVVLAASDEATVGTQVETAPWFTVAPESTGEVIVSDVRSSAFYPDTPVVGFAAPVTLDSTSSPTATTQYVYAEVAMDFVARHIVDIDPGPGGQVLLVDKKGRVIADSHGARLPGGFGSSASLNGWAIQESRLTGEQVAELMAFRRAREGASGAIREPVGGRDTIIGYTPLKGFGPYPGLGWSLLVLVPTKQALATVITQAWLTALILLLGLLMAIAVSIGLSGQLTAPLLRLVEVTCRAETGDLSDNFPPAGTGDEIHQLTEGFRSMVRAINQKQKELEEAHRLQSEFLTNVTHESRTPLTAILAVCELLDQEVAGPLTSRQAQYIRSIAANASKVTEWINNILDLARAEAGRIELNLQGVSLPEVAESIRDTVEGLVRAKSIQYQEKWGCPDSGLPLVLGDLVRMRQIMQNLLSNAVKFTPPGGTIILGGYRVDPGWVALYVQDTGIGIAPEDQERIFEKFQQADNSASRSYPGSGLGLALVRHLVELHGGKISVQSAPGRGATFTVLLPEAPSQGTDGATNL